jgi:hypothetical protein
MGSGSKKQETMAKIVRERAVKGRRDRQQQQKRAAAAARDASAAKGSLAKPSRIEGWWAVRPTRVSRGR